MRLLTPHNHDEELDVHKFVEVLDLLKLYLKALKVSEVTPDNLETVR